MISEILLSLAVLGALAPKNIVLPDSNILYPNEVTVNDSGNDYQVDSNLYPFQLAEDLGYSTTGKDIYVTMSTAYFTVGQQAYTLQGFGMPTDILTVTTASTNQDYVYGIDEWSFYIHRNAYVATTIYVNRPIRNLQATDIMSEATGINQFLITFGNTPYIGYTINHPYATDDDIYIKSTFWKKYFSQPFVDFMSGFTTGSRTGYGDSFSKSEYLEYGRSEYERGKDEGYNLGLSEGNSRTGTFFNLIGGIVSVPMYILNGLSAFTIWDISIVAIIVTLLMFAVILWIIGRLMGK